MDYTTYKEVHKKPKPVLYWESRREIDGNGKYIDNFFGLSNYVNELPKAANNNLYLRNGSTAYCIDTGDIYMYATSTDQWYKQ